MNKSVQHIAGVPVLTEQEFTRFQTMIYEIAGISLSKEKKPLVSGRLAKRLKHYGLDSFGAYFQLLRDPRHKDEVQMAVDLLTTNETYFFREPKHFDFLRLQIPALRRPNQPFRVWSAASSSGEEPYTIAMVLADVLGEGDWEVVGSDISTRVLEKARSARYPMTRLEGMPKECLRRYCLKGSGPEAGFILMDRKLRSRMNFIQINLNETLPKLGLFDVVFLRNVMIYFEMETKRQVVERVIQALRPGGYLFVSHSESLNGVTEKLKMVTPSIYRKPDA